MLLDHHDRAVDEEAEIDRAEAHQVAGDAEHDHAANVAPSIDSGNRGRHQQASAEAAQQ